ncbi:MAG: NUDIX hydrolase [Patescibacteria group bacterium]|jgi:ADP-ribose pyrophosphatase YjhB (NUDIX family)
MSDYKLRVSAKGLFFNKAGEVLLVKSSHKSIGDFWCVPGGGVEEGEAISDAAERELAEETGYIGKVDKIVFTQDLTFHNNDRQLEIFFSGKINEEIGRVAPTEIRESKFFSIDEFRDIEFKPQNLNPFELKEGIDYSSARESQD